jgi:hypothetical protein
MHAHGMARSVWGDGAVGRSLGRGAHATGCMRACMHVLTLWFPPPSPAPAACRPVRETISDAGHQGIGQITSKALVAF